MPTYNELYEESRCFLCYGLSEAQALKLALLVIQARAANPEADLSPQALLDGSACFVTCALGNLFDLFELALLAIIADNPCAPPGNVDGLIWGPSPETVDSIAGANDDVLTFLNTLTNGSNYTTLSFGNPTTVTNSVDFNGSVTLDSITFRLLETVGATFDVSGGTALESVSAPILQSVGVDVDLKNNASLTAVSFPALATVGDDVLVSNSPLVTTISLPLLASIGGDLAVDGTGIVNIALPLLATVNFVVISGGVIEVLSLPSLAAYPPGGIQADASLLTLNLPACVDDGAGQLNVDLASMTGLVTLNVNSMVTITNGPTLNGSPNLASFVAGAWLPTDGNTYEFSGCSLDIPSVENILRRGIVGAVTTSTFEIAGGTNAGLASLSAQAQQDAADLVTAGNTVNINP